ncbi:ATP-binding protein [Rubrivirga marina]|uniref:Orc1-like AAA ATPase domain-containing protein n=1 Tax=Rubrivirga marina TaxID=1196024 RepID=A0A271IXG2_9BACT|nr:ATP-binding protein [Rubrivirga marina]PAP75504.1 hypothetical protein BSZ37_03110 [Rubrivirga marina]
MRASSPPSTATLGDRLQAARHRRFVGRERELSRFADALDAEALPFHLALVHGPGGIGKTALLDEVARLGIEAGVAVARLDGRDLDPTPVAFAEAADAALSADADRRILLVDTYEQIEPLDGWLRRTFVPGLRASDLVVLAGRNRPSADWRTAWPGEAVEIELRALAPDEAATYLSDRGIPEEAHARVQAFTHGHPLALALVTERLRQSGGGPFDPGTEPGLLSDLLERFVSSVPSPAHRAALEGASVVRSVTVPLLGALLPNDAEADALFAWLRGLAFVETDARGARLHDVVRETIEADLRWRDQDRYATVHARARRHFVDRLRSAPTEADRHQAFADYLHLYRHNAVVEPLLASLQTAWADAHLAGSGPLRDGDAAAIRALVTDHHGEDEAEAVAGWLERRPEAAEVFYAEGGGVAGFLLTLSLDALADDERAADSVVAAVWDAVGTRLREGERGLLFRSWLDAEAGQGISAVQSLVFVRTVERYLSTPSLATSVLLTAAPALWTPVFEIVGLKRLPAAEVDGGPLAAFSKDWRATPPDAWLDSIAAWSPSGVSPPRPDDSVVVLGREAFTEAVRDALRGYARPHLLSDSPLLEARLVREQDGDPVEALRTLLSEAADELNQGIRDRPYFRALDTTYFRPAPTQALAAERLGVPFSTYRRHLGRGVDHVVDALWDIETGG